MLKNPACWVIDSLDGYHQGDLAIDKSRFETIRAIRGGGGACDAAGAAARVSPDNS